ncbi:ribonuclease inhibitor-like [Thunnus maccoyii]|uniref:ribonuclease inhibitor-like n=1 Tax=Thunnus maccoyii TaxID=8240 RepID=UPI001C4B19D0|nr:ribonuclease inhibitor-like [Thunnus maccoyii]
MSVLRSQSSSLREVEVSNNNLQDSGVKLLSAGLKRSYCVLEILRLRVCNLSERSSAALPSVLRSQSSSMRELEVSNNNLQVSGVKLLSAGLKRRLKHTQITQGGPCWTAETEIWSGLVDACELKLDKKTTNRKLKLSDNNRIMGFLSEVYSLSGLSRSLQKVRLRLLEDLMNGGFGQTSALADLPEINPQCPQVCRFTEVRTFGFSLHVITTCCAFFLKDSVELRRIYLLIKPLSF